MNALHDFYKDDAERDYRPPEFSDEALALRFAEQHANDLRYVAAWGRWLEFTGRVWRIDETYAAFDLVRRVCREAASQCNKPNVATAVASAKTVAAVERLAKADRRLAARVDQWDADPWLLNTPGGVIDLQTGHQRPHQFDDYLTKITAVSAEASCPTFLACLARSMNNDQALVNFMQRLFGYALCGSTREHALAFFYGTGANGKTLLLSAASGAIGDYHRVAPIETFTASSVERHPTELAGLRGARLVTATETEEGRRWAESRIKALTGGEIISVRFMRQDFFEFAPTFKLIIAGNHKPGLRAVDEAIRRRFHLVPFSVTIPPEERDDTLPETLVREWPGILGWMVEGCTAWQREGLNPPEAVRVATAAYLENEDAVGAWLDECCVLNPNAWGGKTELFHSWKTWADRAGEFAGQAKRFWQALEARGFQPHRTMHGKGFYGLRIRDPEID